MTEKETINTVGELIKFLQQNFEESDILSATYTEYGPNGSTKDIHKRPLLKSLFNKISSNVVEISQLIY